MGEPSIEPNGRRGHTALLLLGLIACAAALTLIRQDLYWTHATLALIAGAVVIASQFAKPPRLADVGAAARQGGRPPLPLRLLAYAGFALAAFGSLTLARDWSNSFDWAAPAVLLGMSVWSVGLAAADRSRPGWVRAAPWNRPEILLFGAVLALDVFFHFHRYNEFPPPDGFCAVEEAFTGRTVMYILENGQRPWEFIGDVWLPVPFFHFFGPSLTTLRIGYTIVSALTVPIFYLLLRELLSVRVALAATALFAVARWHVVYGRHAHPIFTPTLILVLVLYLCVRIHRRGGLAAYPAVGFLSGFTLYTYAGFRSTPLYAGLFLLISLGIHLRSEHGVCEWSRALRLRFVGLALAALGLVVALLPLAGRLYNNPSYLFEAAFRSTVVNPHFREGSFGDLVDGKVQQAKSAFGLFNHRGDDSEVFNLAGWPMLDPVSGALLVIGAAYCAIRWRRRFQGYFLLIALTQLLLGAVAVGHLDVRRLASVIPFLFILIAFAIDGLLTFFDRYSGKTVRSVANVVLLVAISAAVYDNYRIYFGGMMQSERVRWAFQTDYSSTTRYMHTLPENAYMLLVSNMLNFFQDNDYAWVRRDEIPGSVTSNLEPVLAGEGGPWDGRQLHIFIVDPYGHDEIAGLLRRTIPGAECEPFAGPDTPPWQRYTSCTLPVDYDAPRVEPTLNARYYRGDAGEPFLEQRQRALSYALFPDECRMPLANNEPPCRAEYSGVWHVGEAGEYDLAAEAQGGTLSLELDGEPITGQAIELTVGAHEIRGRARFETLFEAGARLKVRPAGSPAWSLVPFEGTAGTPVSAGSAPPPAPEADRP